MSKTRKGAVRAVSAIKRVEPECTQIVVVSDTHAGCKVAVCPESVQLDNGGEYKPSKLQRKINTWWDIAWNEWLPTALDDGPFTVVHNADAVDGPAHHDTVTQISANMADQINIAEAMLRPVVDRCEGRYYQIRGTEAHVGKSGQWEEILAKRIGAIPNEDGEYSRWELRKKMRGNHIIHFTHHVGTTSSAAYESTAIHKELVESYNQSARWGFQPPSMIVRSHRHCSIVTQVMSCRGDATALVTPGWQAKTPFSFRSSGRVMPPQFGIVVIKSGAHGIYHMKKGWVIEPSEPE
jgi:hypothetical protein